MSIMKDINYIKELMVIPCAHPDIITVIETAFTSAPPALLTLFTPGCTEIIKTKLGLAPWHHRGVKALLKGTVTPQAISATKFLYKIGYFAAEKYLYWWMVADVTSEFITTWQSQVYQAQQCQLPGAGTAYGYFAAFVYQPDQQGYLAWTTIKARPGVIQGLNQIAIMPGFEAAVAYTVNWDSWPVPGQSVDVTTWLEEVGNPEPQDLMTTNDPNLKNGNQTLGSTWHKKIGALTPTIYRVGFSNNGGTNAQPVGTSWNIGLHGRQEGNHTFGCHLKPVSWPFPNPLN